jgi:CheY-like chemotaxis protein
MLHTQASSRFTVLLPPQREGWHDTVTRLLEPQGVHTLTARSGRDVLDILESTPIHAVILDTQMPQIGGLQVIKLLREMHKNKLASKLAAHANAHAGAADPTADVIPPSILLTQHLTTHLLREALGMRVFSVLSKPVDFNLLLDALARLLKRYHENRWPSSGPGEGKN